tara:strand:+ start:725 stop:1138 length:414 start_codon:yes stop_codon:yes gene_type:complete
MVTFRNNNGRRNTFRRNERNFKSNGERNKFNNNFSNSENFQRKAPGRNNHNASKLIEKYNNLAREALSGGDKILSENYFQHADHFTRIFNEKEIQKKTIFKNQISENNNLSDNKEKNIENLSEKKQEKVENKHSEAN